MSETFVNQSSSDAKTKQEIQSALGSLKGVDWLRTFAHENRPGYDYPLKGWE